MTQLIKHFKSKNKKVVAVKYAPHKYYLEPETTDTFKFLAAGCDETCLVAKNELLTMKHLDNNTDIFNILETQYADCDVLLLEGLHREGIPLIEVFDSSKHDTLKYAGTGKTLSAVVSDKPVTNAAPCFNNNDINGIINFIEEVCNE